MPDISERSLEEAIEAALLWNGPDAIVEAEFAIHEGFGSYGDVLPEGYRKRSYTEYDRGLCLIPRDVVDFVLATQPKEWEKLKQHHGAEIKERFLSRLSQEIAKRGALDVLRKGIKDSGCKFQLAYFRPASGLNEELQRLHAANLFAIVSQLRYSMKSEDCLDLAIFLNGIPIFTAELKNPLTGQIVQDAIRQYQKNRDPREPLFANGRCLAHFAVDPDLVYVTARLQREHTLSSVQPGRIRRSRQSACSTNEERIYATAYFWERILARDSVLDLIRQFIQEVDENEKGEKLGGVNAVQTLSRLNRTHPDKPSTIVLDFENEAKHIRMSFEPYYTITQLSEQTDPNLLYETQSRLLDFGIYTEADVNEFAKVYFTPKITQDRIYSALAPFKERFMELSEDERHGFRSMLNDYIRLYSFLSQVLTFADEDLEKLHVFARMMRRYLPAGSVELPREIQQNIDMESYRIQQMSSGKITLERRAGLLDPKRSTDLSSLFSLRLH
ncbi:hypothetical protein L0222_26995 [bacterium]|nr:hypothetical protein [bacterium]